ncbi:MAG: biotin/lipoate A/B protein ligase family protein [Gammaproteobacteria bacterium]|nr:biotin/lipoate A/B protein ligase family protein [Gammaproteobacteria bacterium]
MTREWRLLDTGLRSAAENMALDRTLLESAQAGGINTLRFLRFKPSALIGFHQSAGQELHLEYCREHGIDVSRRITGGGALYCDEGQIGWELFLDRRTFDTADMLAIAGKVCGMAVQGLRRLGIDAAFRPRNDIEVAGRKIGGTGGAFDGEALLYQGTVLVDFDIERMLKVLRIPQEKLSDKAIASARERITTLNELAGDTITIAAVQEALTGAFADGFGVTWRAQQLTADEQGLFARYRQEMDSQAWVYETDRPRLDVATVSAVRKTSGGLVRVMLLVDRPRERIKQAFITGDFFVNPKRTIVDLEAALRDSAYERLADIVDGFFATHPAQMLLLTPADIRAVIEEALAQEDRAAS